jgi:YD repeat-containing protein
LEGFGTFAVFKGADGLSDYTNVRHIIDGRKGAICVDDPDNCELDPDNMEDGFGENDSCPRSGAATSEPIDLRQGRFYHNFSDLTLGEGSQALTFLRSYYSSNSLEDSGMGYGWGHGFSARLTRQSNGFEGLGKLGPIPAAPALAAIFVTQDLLEAGLNVDKLYLTSMIDAWLTEQLTDNTIDLNFPGGSKQFFKNPDGTFSGASCCSFETLIANDPEGYTYTTKHGQEMVFDGQGRLMSQSDPNGYTITYTYGHPDGFLTRVENSFGRGIDLTYSNGRLADVSGAGMSVSFGYDAQGRLVSSTDPEGKVTTYQYDAKNRMTSFTNPGQTTPFVVNT